MPVSATISTKRSSTLLVTTRIWPSFGVNLEAFLSRFQTTCCRRAASPATTWRCVQRQARPRRWRLAAKSPAQTVGGRADDLVHVGLRRAPSRACRVEMRVTSSRSSISISSALDVPADQLDRAAQPSPAARRCARASATPSRPASAACAARARGWRGSDLGVARGLGLGARLAVVDQRLHQLGPAGLERLRRRRAPCVWSRKILTRPIGARAVGVAHRHHHAAAPEAACRSCIRCQRSSAARPSASACARLALGAPPRRSSSMKMMSARATDDLVLAIAGELSWRRCSSR